MLILAFAMLQALDLCLAIKCRVCVGANIKDNKVKNCFPEETQNVPCSLTGGDICVGSKTVTGGKPMFSAFCMEERVFKCIRERTKDSVDNCYVDSIAHVAPVESSCEKLGAVEKRSGQQEDIEEEAMDDIKQVCVCKEDNCNTYESLFGGATSLMFGSKLDFLALTLVLVVGGMFINVFLTD